MPLLCIKDSLPDVRLALWHLEETAEELLERYDVGKDFSEQVFLNNKSAHRRAEIIVVRLLIDSLFSRDVVLNHDKSGRPLLSNGYFISISHTSNIVAVIVSNIFEVSVDVEHISNRVVRVADRFMRSDEKANETIEYLLHWCVRKLFTNSIQRMICLLKRCELTIFIIKIMKERLWRKIFVAWSRCVCHILFWKIVS